MKVFGILLLCFLSLCVALRAADYSDHQVVRVLPQNVKQLQILRELRKKNQNLDFWLEPRSLGRPVDIRIPPAHLEKTKAVLKASGLHYSVKIENLGYLVRSQLAAAQEADFFAMYHSLEELQAWAKLFASQNPTLVKVLNIGKSYEGRDLLVLKISGGNSQKKAGFWIDGGIHAREWVSPATVIYMANQLVVDYKKGNKTIVQLLDNLEVYVMPVFNVDGYKYTWTDDRMWRKTRSPNDGSDCVGTDPNRNWDYQWGGEGGDSDPCSDAYYGANAFSEIEVKTVADFIYNNRKILKGYINFHSYSQLWMSPWGYTSDYPADFKVQNDLSKNCVKALTAVYGTQYAYGPIATTIYPAAGNSADWTYGNSSIVYSYGVELRDQGQYGFVLPANQIVPSGIETYAALTVFAQTILKSSIAPPQTISN